MNKKIIISILLITVTLFACYMFFNKEEKKNNNEKPNDLKTVVVYFSATGTTKKVAEDIKDITKGDIIEITPKELYTNSDLNYNNDASRANKEQNDKNARPEIGNDIDLSSYEIVYLGYPIWWGDVPKIILTFLDNQDLTNKTVIPFCTSGSSSINNSLDTLKNYKNNINWIDGSRLTDDKDKIEEWINNLNY